LKIVSILLTVIFIFTACSQKEIIKNTALKEDLNTSTYCKTIIDEKKKFSCYLENAEKGNISSQSMVANYYNIGKIVTKDKIKAEYWFRKAGMKNDKYSQRELGLIYLEKKDYKNSFIWFEKAALQNDVLSQNEVAYFYEKGLGVEKNYKKALYWYRKTAAKNNIYGLEKVGYFYAKGYEVAQDYKESYKWFDISSKKGSKYAVSWLAYQYEMGYGVNKDYEKAKSLYEKSATEYSKGRLKLMKAKRLIK